MTADLTGRAYELTVDDQRFTGHRVVFKVEKTLKPDPNTAEITIYNLTDAQRDAISSQNAPLVTLAAGYQKDLTQIFYGNLVHVVHEVEGADIKTTMTSGDGIEEYRKKRVKISFGPKVKAGTVIQALIDALGLKKGNSDKFVQRLKLSTKANIFLSATALSGSASLEMTALCRSANLEWSIQDGAIQLLDKNTAIEKFAIKLSAGDREGNKVNTGLVGSPSISNKGVCTGKCLIVPDMYPGRQVEIDSRFLQGRFRLTKVNYSGDTHGQDWYCEFEGSDANTHAKVKKTTGAARNVR